MQKEREELVKRIFPQLRKLCEDRFVTWGEVDLRWGITDEQTAEGRVLPICLAEIERCRPYFIGLLGERYGSLPDQIPQELIEQEPWLREHLHHSVMELEILHGVLRNPQMADRSLFYFRDLAYLDHLALGADPADYRSENQAASQKLAALKDRIRASGLPLRENYPDPQALGQLVLEDLTRIINDLYPEGAEPAPLDREAAEHEAFAQSRTRVYIGRREYFDRLNAHAAGDGPPLVILGEPGCGKSALLANWALRYREQHPDGLVLMHFIGASPYSADWAAMVRRIMGELKRRFEIPGEIPDKPDELRLAFANWLHMAAARGRAVIVLDALNQLEDREGALDLVWLPPVTPGNVRLLLSTLPGRPLDNLNNRGWPTMTLGLLRTTERLKLVYRYLRQYRKRPSREHGRRIATCDQTANPLFLTALLEELRLFGVHERLVERAEHCLAAPTVPDLYERILARWEEDYERERPGLVRDAMTAIWAARRGLSETELLDLLGSDGQPLPRAHWSPLYLVAEQALVSRSGRIGFFHNYLREAVRRRYLPEGEGEHAAHRRLADYFAAQELGPRQVDELPWQLAKAKSWQRLRDLLSDLTFLEHAWEADQFDVRAYWASIEANSSSAMVTVYQPVLEVPATHDPSGVWLLARLLDDCGYPREALSLLEHLISHSRRIGNAPGLSAALGHQAQILRDRGDLERAMALHKEEERLCRELGNRDGLLMSLANQASILFLRGRHDEAMALHEEEEKLSRELGNKDGLQACLGNQSLILQDRGDLERAMALLKEEERLCRELGRRDGVQMSLANQANILFLWGRQDEAMALYEEKERLCRELGDKHGLQGCLGNQAVILWARGDLEGAMALLQQQEHLCRELGIKHGLQGCLGNQALILRARDDLDGAMALHQEQERLCRALGSKNGLRASLDGQALILRERGDLERAMALHKEEERLCRELGSKHGLACCLGNQAVLLHDRGDLDEAMALNREVERLCRELGSKDSLTRCLRNQALILRDRGDLEGAMALHQEEERLCRELGSKDSLTRCLRNQALILRDRGDLEGAMALHQEEERLCRELGNKDGLRACLVNQALILGARGDLDEAMALLKEHESLCRELGSKGGLQACLGGQAVILRARGHLAGAMELRQEQERLCRELGNPQGLVRSLTNQALLSQNMGHPQEGLPLAEEAYRLATEHGLTALAEQVRPILESIRGGLS
jgi:tetratricopeptide (TPR) repeat protein